jgi:hypothetical protein
MTNAVLRFQQSAVPEDVFNWIRRNVPADTIVRLCADELSSRKNAQGFERVNGDWFLYTVVVERQEDADRIAVRWPDQGI